MRIAHALTSSLSRLDAASCQAVGWLADRRIPAPLRRPLFTAFAHLVGADLGECLAPLATHASLSAFFVRRLRPDARPVDPDPQALLAPCDGRIQEIGQVERGSLVQAKGIRYSLAQLSGGLVAEGELEGALAITIYLAPRDYHRVHAPCAAELGELRWITGGHSSVAPAVVARRPVFATNERCALELATGAGRALLVLVGARNVSRIRVVGIEPGRDGRPGAPRALRAAEELARFELGSTVVLVLPPGRVLASPTLVPGAIVRQGARIGRFTGTAR